MQIVTITKEEYTNLLNNEKKADFLQSIEAASKMERNGFNVQYVKGVEKGLVKAFCMIGKVHLLKFFQYAYIPRGMFIDYNDVACLKSFIKELQKELKKQRVIYLEIDPKIPYKQRDVDGNLVEGGFDHSKIITNLIDAGFHHLPMTRGYDLQHQCRWMSVLDLRGKTKDTVFSEFSTKTRNDIRNAEKYGVKVRELKEDELYLFHELEQKAGARHSFEVHDPKQSRDFIECYGNLIKVLYAYLDLDEYHSTIVKEQASQQKKVTELETFIQSNPNAQKKIKRLKAEREYYDSLCRKVDNFAALKDKFGKELPLACSMFIKFNDQVVYLFSGSDHEYRIYRGPYALQWKIIQEAIEEGYSFYNMYGISGNFGENEDGYGVFDFKRGFNCTVVELIGNFHLILRPWLYKFAISRGKI